MLDLGAREQPSRRYRAIAALASPWNIRNGVTLSTMAGGELTRPHGLRPDRQGAVPAPLVAAAFSADGAEFMPRAWCFATGPAAFQFLPRLPWHVAWPPPASCWPSVSRCSGAQAPTPPLLGAREAGLRPAPLAATRLGVPLPGRRPGTGRPRPASPAVDFCSPATTVSAYIEAGDFAAGRACRRPAATARRPGDRFGLDEDRQWHGDGAVPSPTVLSMVSVAAAQPGEGAHERGAPGQTLPGGGRRRRPARRAGRCGPGPPARSRRRCRATTTCSTSPAGWAGDGHRAAAGRELQCVGDQVEGDLLDGAPIGFRLQRARRQVAAQADAGPVGLAAHQPQDDQAMASRALVSRASSNRPGLDLRDVEHVVDQLEQVRAPLSWISSAYSE